ncbi:MAG TPA: SHOCT domain-containing protein [Gaiellaceae bacterium]|nr:SHOCT domain-containing protein [Gaiellaceae bacterium]
MDRLTRLADLLDRGAISAEEFAKLKAELLS